MASQAVHLYEKVCHHINLDEVLKEFREYAKHAGFHVVLCAQRDKSDKYGFQLIPYEVKAAEYAYWNDMMKCSMCFAYSIARFMQTFRHIPGVPDELLAAMKVQQAYLATKYFNVNMDRLSERYGFLDGPYSADTMEKVASECAEFAMDEFSRSGFK